jgi:hypothetical protein
MKHTSKIWVLRIAVIFITLSPVLNASGGSETRNAFNLEEIAQSHMHVQDYVSAELGVTFYLRDISEPIMEQVSMQNPEADRYILINSGTIVFNPNDLLPVGPMKIDSHGKIYTIRDESYGSGTDLTDNYGRWMKWVDGLRVQNSRIFLAGDIQERTSNYLVSYALRTPPGPRDSDFIYEYIDGTIVTGADHFVHPLYLDFHPWEFRADRARLLPDGLLELHGITFRDEIFVSPATIDTLTFHTLTGEVVFEENSTTPGAEIQIAEPTLIDGSFAFSPPFIFGKPENFNAPYILAQMNLDFEWPFGGSNQNDIPVRIDRNRAVNLIRYPLDIFNTDHLRISLMSGIGIGNGVRRILIEKDHIEANFTLEVADELRETFSYSGRAILGYGGEMQFDSGRAPVTPNAEAANSGYTIESIVFDDDHFEFSGNVYAADPPVFQTMIRMGTIQNGRVDLNTGEVNIVYQPSAIPWTRLSNSDTPLDPERNALMVRAQQILDSSSNEGLRILVGWLMPLAGYSGDSFEHTAQIPTIEIPIIDVPVKFGPLELDLTKAEVPPFQFEYFGALVAVEQTYFERADEDSMEIRLDGTFTLPQLFPYPGSGEPLSYSDLLIKDGRINLRQSIILHDQMPGFFNLLHLQNGEMILSIEDNAMVSHFSGEGRLSAPLPQILVRISESAPLGLNYAEKRLYGQLQLVSTDDRHRFREMVRFDSDSYQLLPSIPGELRFSSRQIDYPPFREGTREDLTEEQRERAQLAYNEGYAIHLEDVKKSNYSP